MKGCKGCSASVQLSTDDIYEIIKGAERDIREGLVDEDIYKKRLTICKECADLLYNTTCRYSGHIVYILAKDENAHCHKPRGGKW